MTKIASPALGSGDIFCYVNRSQEWVLSIDGSDYQLSDGRLETQMSLLPFIELKLSEIQEKIKHEGETPFLPVVPFIRSGFKHGSQYWVNCALGWLEHSNFSECGELVPLLEKIENEEIPGSLKKRYSQNIRNKARKLRFKVNKST